MKQIGSVLWPKLLVLQIYGANTGVGKTIFSSILCRAFQRSKTNVKYLKPVSTGPLDEADDQYVSPQAQAQPETDFSAGISRRWEEVCAPNACSSSMSQSVHTLQFGPRAK
jgi:dethiobiotin synthetase